MHKKAKAPLFKCHSFTAVYMNSCNSLSFLLLSYFFLFSAGFYIFCLKRLDLSTNLVLNNNVSFVIFFVRLAVISPGQNPFSPPQVSKDVYSIRVSRKKLVSKASLTHMHKNTSKWINSGSERIRRVNSGGGGVSQRDVVFLS